MKIIMMILVTVTAVAGFAQQTSTMPASLPIGSQQELKEYALSQVNFVYGGVHYSESSGADELGAHVSGDDKVFQITEAVNNYRPELTYFTHKKDGVRVGYGFNCLKREVGEDGYHNYSGPYFSAYGEVSLNSNDEFEVNGINVKFKLQDYIQLEVGNDVSFGYVVVDDQWHRVSVYDGKMNFPSDFAGEFSSMRLYSDSGLVAIYDYLGSSVPSYTETLAPFSRSVAGIYSINLSNQEYYANHINAEDVTIFGEGALSAGLEVRSDASDSDWVGGYIYVGHNLGGEKGDQTTPDRIILRRHGQGKIEILPHPDNPGWFYIQTQPGEVWYGEAIFGSGEKGSFLEGQLIAQINSVLAVLVSLQDALSTETDKAKIIELNAQIQSLLDTAPALQAQLDALQGKG